MIDPSLMLAAAGRLRTMTTAGIALLLALSGYCAFQVLLSPIDVGTFLAHRAGFDAVPLMRWQAWTLIAIVAGHFALWFGLLVEARHLFVSLENGRHTCAARRARMLSILLWGLLAWSLLSTAIVSVTATWGYPVGSRVLGISIGLPQATLVIAALMAGFMAHALRLTADLWQDHREVI